MVVRAALVLALITTAVAGERKPITAQAGNLKLSVQAVAYLNKEDIKRELGSELPNGIVLVAVTVSPKGSEPLKLFADDFLLHSYNDGQKSGPFAPSQIAGRGGLALSEGSDGGGVMAEDTGPIYGGIGGGYPGRMPGSGGGFGNSASVATTETTVNDGKKEKENPLLKILKQKGLPDKEISAPVKGFLYFPLEGKHKAKDLGLVYNGAGGKLTLEFHQ